MQTMKLHLYLITGTLLCLSMSTQQVLAAVDASMQASSPAPEASLLDLDVEKPTEAAASNADDIVDLPYDTGDEDVDVTGDTRPTAEGADLGATVVDLSYGEDSGAVQGLDAQGEVGSASGDTSSFLPGTRLTLAHQLAAGSGRAAGLTNNRSSFRVEYERHFLGDFYLRIDGKLNLFYANDHRAQAEGRNTLLEGSSRDAYVQYSRGNTSLRLGRQTLIWGESDAGAITDVISPRNFSELFFISLEESRIAQFMVNVDQFSKFGDWGLFLVPDAQFNEYPEPGTAYFNDPLSAFASVTGRDTDRAEYGARWKRTFGRTDLSVMAARLIDNDLSLVRIGIAGDGRQLLERRRHQYDMLGFSFNQVTGNVLITAEAALKMPRAFATSAFDKLERNGLDASVRIEYSLGNGGNHSASLEAVSRRVHDWNTRIVSAPKRSESYVLGWNNAFLNENLTVNLLAIYGRPYGGMQTSLFAKYKWGNRFSTSLDLFYSHAQDTRDEIYLYRGTGNAVFRVIYQF